MPTKPAAVCRKGAPKILFLDIETAPLTVWTWGTFKQNIAMNQIKHDWSILSFCAKWQGSDDVIYKDLAKARNVTNDLPLLKALWKLLDTADIVVAQNGLAFDKKRIYARFAIHGLRPPAPFKIVDTLLTARRVFGFTSNKLEYLSDKLNKKFKKSKHGEFAGFDLWRECMSGNPKAWAAMRSYNIHDVLALEELYNTLLPWDDRSPNHSLYHDGDEHVCGCGSTDLERRGWAYTTTGKFQRYRCHECGAWSRDNTNILSNDKRASLHRGVGR